LVRNLPVGDFVIGTDTEEGAWWIVERKTPQDLAASIVDGRYQCQKERLRALMRGEARRVAYVVEGILPDPATVMASGVRGSALRTALFNSQVVDGFGVFVTRDPEDTCRWLLEALARIRAKPMKYEKEAIKGLYSPDSIDGSGSPQAHESPKKSPSMTFASSVRIKKADNLDATTCALLQLCVVPRMSPTAASAFLKFLDCTSIWEFCRKASGLGSNFDDVVSSLSCVRVGKRAAGMALARNLVTVLGLHEPQACQSEVIN
jgi:hypothetical protein